MVAICCDYLLFTMMVSDLLCSSLISLFGENEAKCCFHSGGWAAKRYYGAFVHQAGDGDRRQLE